MADDKDHTDNDGDAKGTKKAEIFYLSNSELRPTEAGINSRQNGKSQTQESGDPRKDEKSKKFFPAL